jgi:hypothetical protein
MQVTYLTLYAHNGAYRLGGLGLVQVGAHDGDWEHCTVRWAGSRAGACVGFLDPSCTCLEATQR